MAGLRSLRTRGSSAIFRPLNGFCSVWLNVSCNVGCIWRPDGSTPPIFTTGSRSQKSDTCPCNPHPPSSERYQRMGAKGTGQLRSAGCILCNFSACSHGYAFRPPTVFAENSRHGDFSLTAHGLRSATWRSTNPVLSVPVVKGIPCLVVNR
jgi:hypothetical protein